MSEQKPLEERQRVQYHGSLRDIHGEGHIVAVSDLDHPIAKSVDGHRYTILLDNHGPIYNVRRQSFTPLDTVLRADEYADEA